jgi:predicted transcriptional regulator YdeE
VRRGSESPELFARIWNAFEARRGEIELLALQKLYFGVTFPTEKEGVTDYLAGMTVADDTSKLEGLELRTVPGGEFAVFECPLDAIGATYQHIFSVWLPGATMQLDPAMPSFEEYPENTPQQPVGIHIPVRQRHVSAGGAG